ncbi:phospho-sugar mutase [Plebeiibacterium sediminum]|uniref:Phospho-sugar mutase n=1 Tax=Plebeiibacterium sediminum TaxID=2992112 RepID=A0AAE3M437_9BACT|nr:phospho-sugar mutase [Plebeiobacterium sediminum]MCW3786489.1 phospho-sugar mutase [Plebeiobacterium sediminum]
MENQDVLALVTEKANQWLSGNYDEETKKQVSELLNKEDKSDLIDAFYKDLEFGTGGLRGIMGPGSNRMNIYTVGAATQGLANYLNSQFADLDEIKVCIGHDCRNNSREFAEISAKILSANGIKALLFDDLRPTPEVSFVIRELNCQSGIIITASHNPKEYNGYKAYWNDGGQMIAPHDTNVIDEVQKITSIDEIKFEGNDTLIEVLGEEMDKKYLDKVKSISLDTGAIERNKDLKIIYTPIHGTGVKLIPAALKQYGFTNIINIPEQDVVSGDFPTVVSPNPEEPAALKMAVDKAAEIDADLVMASDPDADRLGIACKNEKGEFILLNGNQTALLLTWYMVKRWKENNLLTGKEFIVKTIVTSELLKEIAVKNDIEYFDVFTGFKWIADKIKTYEGEKKYICGGEESYGFLPGDYVRDKDAVASCAMFAEIAAWAKDNGVTLFELLQNIYIEYGFSKEKMIYIVRKGKSGADEIQQLMKDFRENPPVELAGSKVSVVKDYAVLKAFNKVDNTETDIDLPATSNVLQFFTEDGSKVSVRPSGTEPKIKFYFEVKGEMKDKAEYYDADAKAEEKINAIATDLKIL